MDRILVAKIRAGAVEGPLDWPAGGSDSAYGGVSSNKANGGPKLLVDLSPTLLRGKEEQKRAEPLFSFEDKERRSIAFSCGPRGRPTIGSREVVRPRGLKGFAAMVIEAERREGRRSRRSL